MSPASSPSAVSAHRVAETEAAALNRRRLQLVVRVLLVLTLVGIPTPITGYFDPATAAAALSISVALVVLAGLYGVALWAISRARYLLARALTFSAWTMLGPFLVFQYSSDFAPFEQAILLSVSTVYLLVTQCGVIALAPWREARLWLLAGLGLFAVTLSGVAVRESLPFPSLATYLVVIGTLATASIWTMRAMMADLEAALVHSEEKRREAVASEQHAIELRERAEAASHAKSRFLANMSHELRTPLNAVLGYVELLTEAPGGCDPQECQRDLQHIHDAGSHLLHLIDAILDLSRVESGHDPVAREVVHVDQVIAEVVAGLRPIALQRGLGLEADLSAVAPIVSDPRKLRQVVTNLVGNAIKYTVEGRVVVCLRAEGRDVVLEVQDTGVGIAQDHLERIFEAFERTDATITRSVGGTGLGLALSRRLCDQLGGLLSVESEIGEGSRFTLRLVEPTVSEPELGRLRSTTI